MIESIVLCEHITEDFKAVNIKKVFYSSDSSVQVLVQMNEIQTDKKILFHWYREGNPDMLMGTYEILVKGKLTYPRFALAGMEIPLLFLEEGSKSNQKWYVLIEIDGYSKKKEFEIKSLNLYTDKSNSNLHIPIQSQRQWDA